MPKVENQSRLAPPPLTERQAEIVGLLLAGRSNKEIATACGLTEGTVKNHLQFIFKRLGVESRIEAVLKAKNMQF